MNESNTCLNCDYILHAEAKFCPNCGQRKGIRIYGLWAMFLDSMGDIFAYDAKLINSIVQLLRYPGRLTSDFISGKRIRYMPPFRLYFFISFLVFLALAAMDVAITPEVSMDGDGVVLDTTADGSINFTITDPDGLIYQQILNIVINDVGDSLLVKQNRWDDFIDRNSEGKISYYFVSSLVRNRHVTAGQFLDEFMGYVPICILSIVPLSAALLSLLLWGKRRYYLETLVFSLHYFAFGLVCYLIYSGLTYLFDSQLPEILFLLSLVVYLFLAIKQAFDLTRWRLVFTTACMVLLLGIIVFPAAIIATSLFTFVFL